MIQTKADFVTSTKSNQFILLHLLSLLCSEKFFFKFNFVSATFCFGITDKIRFSYFWNRVEMRIIVGKCEDVSITDTHY